MNSFKTVLVSLSASVILHGAIAAVLGYPTAAGKADPSQPIQIDYLQVEKKAPPQREQKELTAAPKKRRGIPVPRMTASEERKKSEEPSDFQKFIAQNLKKQELQLARLAAEQTESAAVKPKSSAEIMADPQKGKIFVGYFSEVKKKIQKTLLDRYANRYSGRGSVTLAFVLNAHGRIERVIVASKDEAADEMLQDLAVQCLRDAAPFGEFPRDLGSQKIAFNVTIFFDGR